MFLGYLGRIEVVDMLGEQRGKSLDDVELTPAEKFLKVPPLLISLSLHQGS